MHAVCSVGVNLFRVLMIYLKPVLPAMATGEPFQPARWTGPHWILPWQDIGWAISSRC